MNGMGSVKEQNFAAARASSSAPGGRRAKIRAVIASRYVVEWEVPTEYLRWPTGGEVAAAKPCKAHEIHAERLVVGSKRVSDVSVVIEEVSVDERHGEFALDEKGNLIYRDFGTRYGSILYILEKREKELAHLTREGCLEFLFDESVFDKNLYLQVGQVETFLRVMEMSPECRRGNS